MPYIINILILVLDQRGTHFSKEYKIKTNEEWTIYFLEVLFHKFTMYIGQFLMHRLLNIKSNQGLKISIVKYQISHKRVIKKN
jgi:hypothetical protein